MFLFCFFWVYQTLTSGRENSNTHLVCCTAGTRFLLPVHSFLTGQGTDIARLFWTSGRVVTFLLIIHVLSQSLSCAYQIFVVCGKCLLMCFECVLSGCSLSLLPPWMHVCRLGSRLSQYECWGSCQTVHCSRVGIRLSRFSSVEISFQ